MTEEPVRKTDSPLMPQPAPNLKEPLSKAQILYRILAIVGGILVLCLAALLEIVLIFLLMFCDSPTFCTSSNGLLDLLVALILFIPCVPVIYAAIMIAIWVTWKRKRQQIPPMQQTGSVHDNHSHP